jgi:glycosyltransferase involved in cell wall biosynthesis
MRAGPQTPRRRVLVVSYLFPPLAGAGVYRWAKMVKFLPEFGWEPTVVTAAGDMRVHRDDGLAHEVDPALRVHRVRDYGCKYVAAAARTALRAPLMEGHEAWMPFATRAVLHELAMRPYDAICTTQGPFTMMKVGLAVRGRSSVPWVMDLRDPSWSHASGVGSPARSDAERGRRRALELAAYRAADRVVVVDEGVREAILADGALGARDIHLVPNGYDDDDFTSTGVTTDGGRHFRLAFLGKLRRDYRIEGLIRALERMLRQDVYRRIVRVTFAGELDREVIGALGRAIPPECLRVEGYLPVREACRLMLDSDLLLFVLPAYPEGGALRVHSKTYNYLRAGRPILAPVQAGAAARLLARSGAARIVPPDDEEAIYRSLCELAEHWRCGDAPCGTDWSFVRQFRRRSLAAQFARVLDGAVERGQNVRRSAA